MWIFVVALMQYVTVKQPACTKRFIKFKKLYASAARNSHNRSSLFRNIKSKSHDFNVTHDSKYVRQRYRRYTKYLLSRLESLLAAASVVERDCVPSFGGEVKHSVPCRKFATCKRSLKWRGSRYLRLNYRQFLV